MKGESRDFDQLLENQHASSLLFGMKRGFRFFTATDMKYTDVSHAYCSACSFMFHCFRSALCCAEGTLLQSQLLFLELLRAQHDGILVHSGLQATGNQQEPHHLLLQSPDQLRHPHGPSRKRGERSRRREDPCARGESESGISVTIIRLLPVEKVISGGGGGGGVIRDREIGSASQVRMCHAIIRSNYILPAGRL